MRKLLKKAADVYTQVPLARRLHNATKSFFSPFVQEFPAGHFYSPLPRMSSVRARRHALFDRSGVDCPGVELRLDRQRRVLEEMAAFYGELPFPKVLSPSFRYHYENRFFSYGDAVVLYAMLRRLRPRRVVEVGSGYSSAVMLDTDERFLGGATRFTLIEPDPERLLGLLPERDLRHCEVLREPVEEVDPAVFDRLDAGDLLFLDSSHVVKVGSDVRHLLARILPRLRPGVVVHFHDVFWPFEYPEEWVLEGRAWNEAYFLHAFLQYNEVFTIEYFNSYMALVHPEELRARMPLCLENAGSSLWLRRVA